MLAGACAVAAIVALAGCSEAVLTSNVRDTMYLGANQAIATNADIRLVHRFEGQERRLQRVPATVTATGERVDEHNVVVTDRRNYLCAEPSPDVAKAVQAAVGLSGGLGVGLTPPAGPGTEVDARLAAQLSFSRAESMAQLTKRIATIQLLRDGMYRACEAYANGAIGREIYTAIVSRYDTTMITMLLAEMAVGNFGSAAILGGNASSDASASASTAGLAAAETRAAQARATATSHTTRLAQLKAERANLKSDTDADAIKAIEAKITAEEELTKDAVAQRDAADQAVKDAKATGAASRAQGAASANASGKIENPTVQASKEIAEVLYRMQRAYINDPRANSLVLMCFSELAEIGPVGKDLRETCTQLRNTLLDRQAIERQQEANSRALLTELGNERITALGGALKDLIGNKTITAAQAAAIVQAVGGPTTGPFRR